MTIDQSSHRQFVRRQFVYRLFASELRQAQSR